MKIAEVCGWLGMVLIHANTLPLNISLIMGTATAVPPLSMILLTWGGLFLFLIRALARRDALYIVSNSIGFALQSVLLSIIVFQGGV